MTRKQKYRRTVWWLFGMDLAAMLCLGYVAADRKIPDKLYVTEEQQEAVSSILENPWISCEETMAVSGKGSFSIECKYLGLIPLKEVKVTSGSRENVMVSGTPVGIYMDTQGVLIIDTGEITDQQGQIQNPAENIVQPGDYIVAFNEEQIDNKDELIRQIHNCQGEAVTLTVERQKEEVDLLVEPVMGKDGEYKLGIWVRDNTQGIGTLTFVDQQGRYGALGHGINDTDTGEILKIKDGILYEAQILAIQKGSKGQPGELSGMISYQPANIIGSIEKNTGNGIYGVMNRFPENFHFQKMPVGYKQEMEIGPASILCSVENRVEEYKVEITRIDMNHKDTNKSFVIQVTDSRLLSLTGGIVQGMSGSPVIQNGKIVGAVTHVFVQDSTSGYGIFVENMLSEKE